MQGIVKRGLRRKEAALYVGVSPTTFDQLVKEGALPKPIHLNGCRVWDRVALDRVFEDQSDANPWDTVEASPQGEGRQDLPTDQWFYDPTSTSLRKPRVPDGVSICSGEPVKYTFPFGPSGF